jgi:enolase
VPLGNVVGGGEHAADATHIQEFLAAPVGAPSIQEAVFANAAVHEEVGELLADRGVAAAKGDEGAWAPAIEDAAAFELVAAACETVEDEFGFEVGFGLDIAATELWDGTAYQYGDESRSPAEQVEYVAGLVDEYDLVYVEDPLEEDDFAGFADLTDRVGSEARSTSHASGKGPRADRTLVCGDDLFVTNVERLQQGIEQDAGNSILIKPNQIGTLSAAVDAIELATRNGLTPVVSHRSGETEDATIAHLAVATGAPFIKTGTVGGERTAKLNELIRIAEDAV